MVGRRDVLVIAALGFAGGRVQAADADTGVVLLHGKWDRPPTNMMVLARQLESAGFKVATPTMPWAGTRDYDATYPQALAEIEVAAERLRANGAKRIVVAGLSFGANAALAYAASGRPVAGVVVLSPGHTPDRPGFRNAVADSVAAARRQVDAGAGKDTMAFEDRNQGRAKQVRTTAAAYLSYFDPEGQGAMPKSAAALPPGTPVWMVVGTADPIAPVAEASIFDRAPKHPKSKYVSLETDHMGVVQMVGAPMIEWLRSLTD